MNDERKFIVSTNYGGICNRLKGWISVLRLAINSNKTPMLYWPQNDLCGCRFTDLFWNTPWELDSIDKIKDDKNYELIDTWRFLLIPEDKIKNDFAKVYPIKEGKGREIDLEYDRIPKDIRESILIYINSLVPKDSIKKLIDNFSQKYNFNELVGVHVRKGDFKTLVDGRGKISTDDEFFKRMDEILKSNPNIKFFLTTDSIDTEKKYIGRYKDKIIVFPKKNEGRDRDKVLGVQEALVDLLLLSKTKHILGTYLSSFTELAWWFGDCKAKVEIIGDDKIKEKEKVIKRLHGKGFVCITKFWDGLIRRVKQN